MKTLHHRLGVLYVVVLCCVGPSVARCFEGEPSLDDIRDYRIVARDEIKFQIAGEDDDALIERVSSAGQISIPLLGAVKIAGLSLREAEAQIENLLKAGGFFVKPQVILSFNSYAPRSVSVLGQVNNPSQIDFAIERDRIGIVDAITKAGGFTRVARTDQVKVMRVVNGKDTAFTIDVSAYLNQAHRGDEFRLQPDDIVFVPERVF